jgi:AbrB family looped-hinge helix DNA binding protein
MRVTIDRAGRMVVPKALRNQLRIAPGAELEARVEGGELIARPVGPEVILVDEDGRLVATTSAPVEPMTTDDLLHLIDESREWPRHD